MELFNYSMPDWNSCVIHRLYSLQ